MANERLASQFQPDGVNLFCAVLNPMLANWRQSLAESQVEGARAIKLHPNYHVYSLDARPACELLAAAGEARLPVIIQLRMQDMRSHHPLCRIPDVPVAAALDAARAAKDTQIVLGGIRFAEMTAQAAAITALPNLWVDLSQVEHSDGMRQAITKVGIDRLVLGTHAPLFNMRSALLKMDEGLLTEHERSVITRENPRRLLEI